MIYVGDVLLKAKEFMELTLESILVTSMLMSGLENMSRSLADRDDYHNMLNIEGKNLDYSASAYSKQFFKLNKLENVFDPPAIPADKSNPSEYDRLGLYTNFNHFP